jgi:hypothetical protein
MSKMRNGFLLCASAAKTGSPTANTSPIVNINMERKSRRDLTAKEEMVWNMAQA